MNETLVNLLYRPLPNRLVRTVLAPFGRWIPDRHLLPVDGPIRVKLPGGEQIVLACNPTSYLAKMLFWRGWRGFEYPLMRVFVPLVRRTDVFVDVGANIGYYSLVAAALNPNAQVFSFEPLAAAFQYLRRSIELNAFRSIRLESLALADKQGEQTFFVPRKEKYDAIADHLSATGSFDPIQAQTSGPVVPIKVLATTLDAYAARALDKPIGLLKLDTESTEHIVLAGASEVLSTHRPVVLCEVLPGRNSEALEAVFKRHEYVLFRAEPEILRRVKQLGHSGQHNDHVMIPAEVAEETERLIAESTIARLAAEVQAS